jgi:hypothetical protein
MKVIMSETREPTENGKSKPLPEAAQPVGNYQRDADIVTQLSGAGALSIVIGKSLKGSVRAAGIKIYLDDVLKAAGATSDPIEKMLIEQITVGHHQILTLHAEAAQAETPELIDFFSSAASKLTAEFRRLCLALREYRSPIAPKNVTLVRQQNLSAGDQQIALIDKRPSVPTQHIETTADPTNQNKVITHETSPTIDSFPRVNCSSTESLQRAG